METDITVFSNVTKTINVHGFYHLVCYCFGKQFLLLLLNLNFKLYSFYNNNTRLQIGHEVICYGGENKYVTFSAGENHWNFFPGLKTLTYSRQLWDSNP